MKKVLMAIDGVHFSNSAFGFIKKMNEQQPVFVTGVVLPAIEISELLYSFGGMTGPVSWPYITEEEEAGAMVAVASFKALCEANNIAYSIHNAPVSNVVTVLKTETRFADLLVLDSSLFYANLGTDRQHEYLMHLLHHAECPVVLVPGEVKLPETLVFAFDGSASSAYALKQFSYLFPYFNDLKTVIVHASIENEVPNLDKIKELGGHQYKNLSLYQLEAEPRKYFESWLIDNKNPMVIAGAYSRSFISGLMKKSFVDEIIQDHNIPVFIAHR